MIHPACGLMYKMTQARDASEGRRWESTRCDVPIKERKNPFLVSMPGPILVYKTPMKNFLPQGKVAKSERKGEDGASGSRSRTLDGNRRTWGY
jgi:hypothetical protein